jgi:hypothetical protein
LPELPCPDRRVSDSPGTLGSSDVPFSSSSPAHRFGVIYFLHNASNVAEVNGFSDFALFCVIYFLNRENRRKFSRPSRGVGAEVEAGATAFCFGIKPFGWPRLRTAGRELSSPREKGRP